MPPWLGALLATHLALVQTLGINGLLALSMYAVLAVGQLSLAQAAFMGLGAYSSALLTLRFDLPFAAVLPAACIAPVLFALAIGVPTVRLAAIYLAIASLGLGEVLRALYASLDWLGGAAGLSDIPQRTETWMIYALLGAALLAFWLVGRSGIGRAMEAVRQDETAAQIMGIDLAQTRLGALLAAAVLAGLAGALSAHAAGGIAPDQYGFAPAVSILAFALLGGIGTPLGPVLGAWILTLLPELLRGVSGLRLALNGVVIVLAVLFLPEGLLAARLRRRAA